MSEENRPVDEEQAAEEQVIEEQAVEQPETEKKESDGGQRVSFKDVQIKNNSKVEAADDLPKPSGKTTVLLISMILVLVAVIAIAVVLIVKNYKDKTDSGSKSGNTELAAMTPDGTSEPRDYDVKVKLGKYLGVKVAKVPAIVTDEQVEEEFNMMIKALAEETSVTGPVEMGDICNIDYAGYMDDIPFEGGANQGFDLEIGSHAFISGFEEGLIGAMMGEPVDVLVTFPNPYPKNPDYSGKPAKFEVFINSITRKLLPEVTDELINTEFSYPTIAEYKDSIRAYLQEEADTNAIAEQEEEAFSKIIADSVFTGDLEEEIEAYAANYKMYWDAIANSYYDSDAASLFMYLYGVDAATFDRMIREESEYAVKYKHVLDQIAKEEKLTVSAAEYRQKYEYIFFQYYGYGSDDEVNSAFTTEQIDEMVNSTVLQEKADALVKESIIVE